MNHEILNGTGRPVKRDLSEAGVVELPIDATELVDKLYQCDHILSPSEFYERVVNITKIIREFAKPGQRVLIGDRPPYFMGQLERELVNYPTLLTRGWGLKSKNPSDLICYHKDMQ